MAGGDRVRGLAVPGTSAAGGEGEGGRCHCPEEEGGLSGGGQGQ